MHFRLSLVITGLILLAGDLPVQAGVIYLDVPGSQLTNLTPIVTARDKISSTNSDQILFKQPTPTSSSPQANLVSVAGNSSFIGSDTYDFTLRHTAPTGSLGSKYDFSLNHGQVTGVVTLTSSASTDSTKSEIFGANELKYNILHVYAQASTTGSQATFSNMSFTAGSGLSTSGVLQTSGIAKAGVGTQSYDQWLAAPTGVNLDLFDWTFKANVTLSINGTNPSSGEGIKFEFTGKQGNFTPVPEPSTFALAVFAIPGLLAVRRITKR
jgi:hypothetical protein